MPTHINSQSKSYDIELFRKAKITLKLRLKNELFCLQNEEVKSLAIINPRKDRGSYYEEDEYLERY